MGADFKVGPVNEPHIFLKDSCSIISLSPWGSWYFSVGSVYKSQLSGKLFLEYGANVSWHNFKFENDKIRIQKNANGVTFVEDPTVTDFVKSKLGTTHLNISLVPVIDFGKKQIVRKKVWERWDNDGDRYKNGYRIRLNQTFYANSAIREEKSIPATL